MKKIAVVGCNSFLGRKSVYYLKSNGYGVTGLSRNMSDLSDNTIDLANCKNSSFNFLNDTEYVLMIAAISSPDTCENQPELCYKVNVEGTCHLINEALKRNIKVIFFSSDAVYGEDTGIPFTENSPCIPISNYGKMKNSVEAVYKGENNFKSFRLSYVLSYDDKFTRYFLSCMEQGITAEIFHPLYRNVICLQDLLQTILVSIKEWSSIPGILNVCGNELISRVNFADAINRIMNKEIDYKIISMEKDFLRIRPKITNMKSLYLPDLLKDYYVSFYDKAKIELQNNRIRSFEL